MLWESLSLVTNNVDFPPIKKNIEPPW